MGAREHSGTEIWEIVSEIPDRATAKTKKEWRATLAPLIEKNDPKAFGAALVDAYNDAMTPELFEAFYAYTDHIAPEFFAGFVAALMLAGKEVFERVTSDPAALAELGVPRDAYFVGLDFFPAVVKVLRDVGVEVNLGLDAPNALSEALLARIAAIDPSGLVSFPPRVEYLESEEDYRGSQQDAVFRRELKKRWPALVSDEQESSDL
jgi:hypothetical protein